MRNGIGVSGNGKYIVIKENIFITKPENSEQNNRNHLINTYRKKHDSHGQIRVKLFFMML